MANERDDGGAAFPVHQQSNQGTGDELDRDLRGMTLRDFFAGKALAGWLAGIPATEPVHNEGVAARAYAIADAMLKARSA